MDANMFMKPPVGCGPLTGHTLGLERSIYGIEHSKEGMTLLLTRSLMKDVWMSQSKVDPSVDNHEKIGRVCVILVVQLDGILNGGKIKTGKVCDPQREIPDEQPE